MLAALAGLTSALGCAAPTGDASDAKLSLQADTLEAELRAQPLRPLGPNELRVRLAFGLEADLDLFLTDPSHESVYFANKTSRTGGTLSQDIRCDAPAPRIEAVTLKRPLPGRYRVGVDFPQRCDQSGRRAVLVVAIERPPHQDDESLVFHRQVIDLEVFEPIVFEFDLP